MKIFPVYSSQEVLDFTKEITNSIIKKGIEGDLVECGVGAGSQLAAMKQSCMENNDERKIYGYDSFCGIPYAGVNDKSQPGIGKIDKNKIGLLKSTGISSHSIENVKENFLKWELNFDNVNFVEGWFQNTIPSSQHDKIALLRLDGDLYESTYLPMKYMFNKLQLGGILIIDDYKLKGCAKAVHEFINRKEIIQHLDIAYYIKK